MIRFFRTSIVLVLMTFAFGAQAHGGDKPGPNGGSVFMPGPYHVELVEDGSGGMMVFLLDMEFKNPVIQNSEVKVIAGGKSGKTDLTCPAMGNHFHCRASGKSFAKGELKVTSRRDGVKGNLVATKWPLPKPSAGSEAGSGSGSKETEHSSHENH